MPLGGVRAIAGLLEALALFAELEPRAILPAAANSETRRPARSSIAGVAGSLRSIRRVSSLLTRRAGAVRSSWGSASS